MSPLPVINDCYYVIADFASDATQEAKHWSNTFFFKDDGATPMSFSAAADAVKVLLDKFYGQVNAPGATALRSFLSSQISLADSRYKVYDLNVPAPRLPETRSMSTSPVIGTTALPNEVSAVISYRTGPGGSGGGTIDKRKRGRLYIGPLVTTAVGSDYGTDVGLQTGLVNALLGAADYLRDQTDNDLTWVQYSRVNNIVGNVTGGFVNNAFDTQRRRGGGGSSRTTW